MRIISGLDLYGWMTFHLFFNLRRRFSGEIFSVLARMKLSGGTWIIFSYASKSFLSGRRACILSLKRGFMMYFILLFGKKGLKEF